MCVGDIELFRNPYDIFAETLTLAHEVGHFESWRRGWPEAYEAARDAVETGRVADLSREQRLVVLPEEARAWECGFRRMETLGMVPTRPMNDHRFESLSRYADLLELDVEEVRRVTPHGC